MWRWTRRNSRLAAGTTAGMVALTLCAAASGTARSAVADPAFSPERTGSSHEVTLPTGDRINVSAKGERASVVAQAPRKDGSLPSFLTMGRRGSLYMIPEDVLANVTDLEPYNVSRLAGLKPAGTATPAPTPRSEPEQHDVRVKAIDRFGRPARGIVRVFDVDDGSADAGRPLPGDPNRPCTNAKWDTGSCVRIPPGTYSALGFVYTMPLDKDSTATGTPLNRSIVGDPELKITKDMEIVLDARKAKEVTVSTPDHVTKRNMGALNQVRWYRAPASGPGVQQGFSISPGSQVEERLYIQPTERVRTGKLEAYSRWRLEAPAITMSVAGHSSVRLEPDYYRPSYFSDVSAEYPRLDGRARLPLVDAGLGRPGDLAGRDLRGKLALVRRSDEIPVATQSNNAAAAGAKFVAVYNDRPGRNTEAQYGTRLTVPTVHLPHEEGRRLLDLLGRGSVRVDAKGIVASPYLYDLLYAEQGRFPTRPHLVARTRQLATIRNDFHSQDTANATMHTTRFSWRPWEDAAYTTTYPLTGAPRSRVEYVTADPDTKWSSGATTPERPYNNQWPRPKTPDMLLTSPAARTYRPGERDRTTWFKQPVAAGVNPRDPMIRQGDQIRLAPKGFADADGNHGDAYTSTFPNGLTTDFRLYADDKLIGQTPNLPRGWARVAPEQAAYRMELDVDNNAVWARLGTRTRTVWSFGSRRPADGVTETLPLLLASYDASLDLRNRARHGVVRLSFRHQDGAPRVPVEKASLAVSYDDGTTWRDVRLLDSGRDSYRAILPRGKGYVSLRMSAEDAHGNGIRQETTRAYLQQ